MRRALSLILSCAGLVLFTACGPKYPNCNSDKNCADKGEVCVNNTCQECRDDSNCDEGQQCRAGRCEAKPECVGDSDCDGNKVCRSGKCQIECESDRDCGAGLECENNRCVDPLACNSDQDCEVGFSCIGGRCSNQNAYTDRCDYPTVRFDFNRATLRPEVRDGLQQVVDCLKSKGGTILIEGHADERGTEEYNLALGERRARAVRDYLTRLGVSSAKLRVTSKGEAEPLSYGSNEAAWAKNRRAEFEEQ
ncbi:MAG: OmpA family protein [Myxococcota bacterium]